MAYVLLSVSMTWWC